MKLQEQNRKAFTEIHDEATKAAVQSVCEQYNIAEEVLNFRSPKFSINKFREGSYALSKSLKEANSELQFGQLLRAGSQTTFNDIYKAVAITFDQVVRYSASNKRQEFYAPLERAGFPKKVARGALFPETSFKGLDIELINEKFGLMLAIEKELIDDDMTGQIMQRISDLAENARIYENFYVWTKIFSKSGGYNLDGEILPVSETYSTVWADAAAGGIHGNGNGVNSLPTSGSARLSQSSIEAGLILAMQMKDQSGRPMLVTLDTLAVSPQDKFAAMKMLESDLNTAQSSTASSDAGKNFGIMTKNVIKGSVSVVADLAIPTYGAALIASGKGFVMQQRDATELIQENPASGAAFSAEIFRHKLRSRWQADWIDPKFAINLNPGYSAS